MYFLLLIGCFIDAYDVWCQKQIGKKYQMVGMEWMDSNISILFFVCVCVQFLPFPQMNFHRLSLLAKNEIYFYDIIKKKVHPRKYLKRIQKTSKFWWLLFHIVMERKYMFLEYKFRFFFTYGYSQENGER